MASLDEIRAARLEKLNALVPKGITPYPVSTGRTHTNSEAKAKFDELTDGEAVTLAGRIVSLRAQGKIAFFDFDDGTSRFQALLKKDDPIPEKNFELFEKAFDIGDFAEIRGTLFLTKQNEKTILAEEVKMLSKSLLPLPEKWHGLQDGEERFRKRYLDLLSNPDVKERFVVRTRLITEIRRILDEAGYLEVETPVLQPLYGG